MLYFKLKVSEQKYNCKEICYFVKIWNPDTVNTCLQNHGLFLIQVLSFNYYC